MDETATFYAQPSRVTLDCEGARQIRVLSSPDEKRRLTVVLCSSAYSKCRPVVIASPAFLLGEEQDRVMAMAREKDITVPKKKDGWGCISIEVEGVPVFFQSNSWNSAELMLKWVDVFLADAGPTEARPRVLIMDSFSGHLKHIVLKKLRDGHVCSVIIPSGGTSSLQPMDQLVNSTFKSALEESYTKHLSDQVAALRHGDNEISSLSLFEMIGMVKRAWYGLSRSTLRNSFNKCGLTPSNIDSWQELEHEPCDDLPDEQPQQERDLASDLCMTESDVCLIKPADGGLGGRIKLLDGFSEEGLPPVEDCSGPSGCEEAEQPEQEAAEERGGTGLIGDGTVPSAAVCRSRMQSLVVHSTGDRDAVVVVRKGARRRRKAPSAPRTLLVPSKLIPMVDGSSCEEGPWPGELVDTVRRSRIVRLHQPPVGFDGEDGTFEISAKAWNASGLGDVKAVKKQLHRSNKRRRRSMEEREVPPSSDDSDESSAGGAASFGPTDTEPEAKRKKLTWQDSAFDASDDEEYTSDSD